MSRFFCVFYTCPDALLVHKKYKKTKVVEADLGINVMHKLKEEHEATFVKYIRDLDKEKPLYVDDILVTQENKNNDDDT